MSFIRRRIEKEPLLSDTSLDQSVQNSPVPTLYSANHANVSTTTTEFEHGPEGDFSTEEEEEEEGDGVEISSTGTRDQPIRSRQLFRQLEQKFKSGWEKIKTIKRPSFLFFPKRKRERDRMNEIESFIDDSTFGLELPTAVPDETRAFASLLQIPYTTLPRDKGVVPTVPVVFSLLKLRIIDSNDTGRHIASNAMFTFELKYGTPETREICWKIRRNLVDIIRIHTILNYRHLIGDIPDIPKFPSQLTYIIDFKMVMFGAGAKNRREERRLRHAEHRKMMLEKYFCTLLVRMGAFSCKELAEFLEISAADLYGRVPLGIKRKEGYLMNRSYHTKGSLIYRLFWLLFYFTNYTYYQKWFVIRDSFIAIYNDIDQHHPIEVILVDSLFDIVFSDENSINPLKPIKVKVMNESKKIEFLIEHNPHSQEWIDDLKLLQTECIWTRGGMFDSWAPLRTQANVQFMIDADCYFEALAREIEQAKIEIFIHGFWVSPELHLRRPADKWPQYRLDKLLQKKAIEGIKICIVVYKEVSIAMGINSLYTKTSFERLHPNIIVVRHPDHFSGSLYWAHHEKIVAIDQRVAFIGGIDLCYGRYDTEQHSTVDFDNIWNGIDYYNPIVKDFHNIHNHENPLVDRTKIPRLPWHDLQCMVKGPLARDISRHFIQRWNFIKVTKGHATNEKIPYLLPFPECTVAEVEHMNCKGPFTVQALRSVCEWSSGIFTERSIYNALIYVIRKAERFIYIENQFFLSRTCKEQVGNVKNCIAQEIVEKILDAHERKRPFKVIIMIPLMPAFEAFVYASSLIIQTTLKTIGKGHFSIYEVLKDRGIEDPFQYISFVSLRTHSDMNGKYVTEQIYVHSKLIVVDDKMAIIGSANINDRSLLGNRDSELALYLEDTEVEIDYLPSGDTITYGKNLRKLRMQLFNEHFDANLNDHHLQRLFKHPFSDEFMAYLNEVSVKNSQIYSEIFQCFPDDSIRTWGEFKRMAKNRCYFDIAAENSKLHGVGEESTTGSTIFTTFTSVQERLQEIRGRVVRFPYQFLCNEDTLISMLSPEYLLPYDLYL